MIYLTIISLALISLLNFIKYQDIINPIFVLSFIWALVLGTYIYSPFANDLNNVNYLIFLGGVISFSLGFITNNKLVRGKIIDKKTLYKNINYDTKNSILNIILIIQFIVLILIIIDAYRKTNSNFIYNWWFTLKSISEEETFNLSKIFKYTRVFSTVLTHVLYLLFLLKRNKKTKRNFIIQFIIALLFSILSLGRTYIFQLFIPIFILRLLISKREFFKEIKIVLISFSILLFFFTIINFYKYDYSDATFSNSFQLYYTSSIRTFIDHVSSNTEFYYGRNTFRFFYAIVEKLGSDVKAQPLVQEFMEYDIQGNLKTNVYTIYKWYYDDFGIIYCFIIQFFLGVIYSSLRNIVYLKSNIWSIVLYSSLFYPLLMQTFQDQYFSILSTWFQILIHLFIIRKIILFNVN
jgi:oligosaccharide repeat unit polymerase